MCAKLPYHSEKKGLELISKEMNNGLSIRSCNGFDSFKFSAPAPLGHIKVQKLSCSGLLFMSHGEIGALEAISMRGRERTFLFSIYFPLSVRSVAMIWYFYFETDRHVMQISFYGLLIEKDKEKWLNPKCYSTQLNSRINSN